MVSALTRGRVCNLLVQFTVTLGSKSLRTLANILLPVYSSDVHPVARVILLSRSRLPPTGGPGPHIYIPPPGNKVAQLYPRALYSLSVASYDSQGYGGGILTRLHTVILTLKFFRQLRKSEGERKIGRMSRMGA
jgi:hypothetical protein